MMTVRQASERGNTRSGWLSSYHTFSFGEYHDPRYMGISNLRVLNEDTVAPGGGFPTHGHRDMEIVSYVVSGALEHRDSMGNGSVIGPGEVQRMSAGAGVLHSEYNRSAEEPVHFLQIWLQPNRFGITPGYEQKHFSEAERRGQLRLMVSPDGRGGSVSAHQEALLYSTLLERGEAIESGLPSHRQVYVHMARGNAMINGQVLGAGDGVHVQNERVMQLEGMQSAEAFLFELP